MDSDRLRRQLKLRDLDTLMTVVTAGGMRKAAEQLHMSQPAVSKAISELENILGVRLVDRSRHGVEPTAFGRALLKRGTAIFDELRLSISEMELLADPDAGELNVGCVETITAGFAAAIVEKMSRQHPRLVFSVASGDAPVLESHFLRDRLCELAIARPFAAAPASDMHGEPLFHEQLRVVVSSDSEWAARRRPTLGDLIDAPWILSANEIGQHSPVVEAFVATGAELPAARVLTGSLNLRRSLLQTGRFVTVMPHSLLRFGPDRSWVKVLPIDLPAWKVATMIITLKNRTLSPVAERFVDHARTLAKLLGSAR
ncbi:LysR family transcriptional regulator [Paraburkholderia sp. LEh10]|uniref:LysR family transcriptional regulator n=1 Tax=Paraburkholderia sp. LEh10 TaxID=2821353 RepID=UPI001AE469F0|nr:LysR family transcriptional regulator [Paraburkholderia sp. LEh10]MBP0595942.1 LysR family transcriptional regulator [Paraburkholderia sp. LEh10]